MFLNRLDIADFDFWHHLQTRWRDMDSLGHINHAAYLSYMESARVDVYIKMGYSGIRKEMDDSAILASMEIHYLEQIAPASEVLDVIQIPAYLCMQTDLAEVASKTGKVINIKHGQFISPDNMDKPVNKIKRLGNEKIILTERGYTFGYSDLIVDPRSFYIMRQIGFPVVFDITHSIRRYGIPSADPKGGNREFLPTLGRAGVGAGVDGLFIETHPNPPEAKCDAASQMYLNQLEEYLKPLIEINAIFKGL